MIHETIAKLEARLQKPGAASDPANAELLTLLNTLKREIDELSKTHADAARSIAGFAQVSAHEATREEKNPELLQLSLRGLQSSVEGFEQSHPRLVQIVNTACNALANLGI